MTQSLFPILTPSSKHSIKKIHIPHKHCTILDFVPPFQAEIFPLSTVPSLHNAATAAAAAAAARLESNNMSYSTPLRALSLCFG